MLILSVPNKTMKRSHYMKYTTLSLKVLKEDVTSCSGREFHTCVARGINEFRKALVQAKG